MERTYRPTGKYAALEPMLNQLRPELRRTFYVDCKQFRECGDDLMKGAVKSWARHHAVRVGVKITNPRLTEQQIVVAVKARAPTPMP